MKDGDQIEIIIDRVNLEGSVNLIGDASGSMSPDEATALLNGRPPHRELKVDPKMPADTRLWAALQQVGGGTWGGCIYDVQRIVETLEAGAAALSQKQ